MEVGGIEPQARVVAQGLTWHRDQIVTLFWVYCGIRNERRLMQSMEMPEVGRDTKPTRFADLDLNISAGRVERSDQLNPVRKIVDMSDPLGYWELVS